MAHVGGFAFGAAVALALRVTGAEKYLVAPLHDDGTLWRRDPGLRRAQAALERGDRSVAKVEWDGVVARDPLNLEARERLLGLAFERQDASAFHQHFDVVAQRAMTENRLGDLRFQLAGRGSAIEPMHLRPALLARLAGLLETDDPPNAARFQLEIVRRNGAHSGKAALQVAKALGDAGRSAEAPAFASAAVVQASAGEETREEGRQILRAMPLDASFTGRAGGALQVKLASGESWSFEPGTDVRALDVGVLARHETPEGARTNVVVVVVFVERQTEALALRFFSFRLGLTSLFPQGTPTREAVARLLQELASAPRAKVSPSREALASLQLPRYEDHAAFEKRVT